MIRYDRKFSRNTTGQFEPVNAGKIVRKGYYKNEAVDKAEVDNNENVGGIKHKMLIPVTFSFKG